tara:strand:+ start:184 stop:462 length:279 start_codon:yes stop_codon:yes gene_type:complete
MTNYKFELSPTQKINLAEKGLVYQNGKAVFNKETEAELKGTIKKALAEKETIFADNKSFSEILVSGILFALGTSVFLTIIASCIIAFINLLN